MSRWRNIAARTAIDLDWKGVDRLLKQVLQILQDMSRKKGATVVIVTHNSAIAPIADRVIHMHDGKVTAVDVNEHPMDIAELEW